MGTADGDAIIYNILVLRSLRQRLALLAQSALGKKGNLEFTFHALESTALICVLETNYCRKSKFILSSDKRHMVTLGLFNVIGFSFPRRRKLLLHGRKLSTGVKYLL